MSAAGGIVLPRSIACDKFRGYKLTSFMSFLMAINSIAPILAPIIGSFIISFAPWQALFYVLTGWGVLLILQTVLFVDESLDKNKRAKSIKDSIVIMKADLFNVRFMLVCIAFAMIMGVFFHILLHLHSSFRVFTDLHHLSIHLHLLLCLYVYLQ